MIETGLAADARIHHGKERRGHLDVRYTAQQGRSGESGQIAHHAAAEGDDDTRSLELCRQQRVEYPAPGFYRFIPLAVRHDMDGEVELSFPLRNLLSVNPVQRRVGDKA